MRRGLCCSCLIALLVLWGGKTHAAEILELHSSAMEPYRRASDGFKEALRERKVSFQTTELNLEQAGAQETLQMLRTRRPDLIFTLGPEASRFAKEQAGNIPVVFSMVLRAEAFAAPNATGVSLEIPFKTKLDYLSSILPNARKIGVIYSPKSSADYGKMVQACKDAEIQLVAKEIASGKDLPDAFKELVWQIDLFVMVPDTKIYFQKSIEYLLSESLKNKVPVMGLSSSFTRAGALVSFEMDYADLGRQAGEMAARIIAGEKPSNISQSKSRRLRTSLNLIVAERLGVDIPSRAIKEASEVFGK